MDNFVEDTIQIIEAIKKYKDKHENTQLIDKYYQTHGTYTGIIEYLNCLEDKKEALKKLYDARYNVYLNTCDIQINGNLSPEEEALLIREEFLK